MAKIFMLFFNNFLSFTNLKNVPLDTPINLAAKMLVNSLLIYLSNILIVLCGRVAFGLPNLTPFSFAILIIYVIMVYSEK